MLVLISTWLYPTCAYGAFQVLSWNLANGLSQRINDNTVIDTDDILKLANPLSQTSLAQVNQSHTSVEYDCAWLIDEAFGHFNMSITHAIRSPEVRTVSRSQIFITADEPIRVSVEGLLNYAHTPGDLTSLSFSASARDVATGDYAILEQRQGGNFYFLPSAGTLSFDGDAILSPGILYRLQYVLDCTNISDLLPTGILDAAGHVNFTISPVPEPATLTLLVPTLAATLLRCRRS